MADSQRIVRVKTRTKAFFFEEILINIPSENLPKLSKERTQNFCHALKLNLRSRSSATSDYKCKRFFDEQLVRTKDNYKFYTAKDPLFNSTGFCKVEDHCRQEHRCDCVCTDRNLSMLEQNLKGQYGRAYLDYSRRGKEKCPWKVPNVVNFVALYMLKFKSHAGIRDQSILSAC